LHAIEAVFFVEVDNHLRVRFCLENMPFGEKFFSEADIVVDLSIEHDPNCTVFVGNRLVSMLQIDDG
jgi:hypothetical protein